MKFAQNKFTAEKEPGMPETNQGGLRLLSCSPKKKEGKSSMTTSSVFCQACCFSPPLLWSWLLFWWSWWWWLEVCKWKPQFFCQKPGHPPLGRWVLHVLFLLLSCDCCLFGGRCCCGGGRPSGGGEVSLRVLHVLFLLPSCGCCLLGGCCRGGGGGRCRGRGGKVVSACRALWLAQPRWSHC